MTTFALVHGAWHGAWCWEPLALELSRLGHDSVAVDLPITDKAAASPEYAAAVVDSLGDRTDDDVVVVGHSLGGTVIPLVGNARPVRALVWVAGVIRRPGMSLEDHRAAGDLDGMFVDGFGAAVVPQPDGSTTWPEPDAIEAFFHDCDPGTAVGAARQLRAQHTTWFEVAPDTPWPDVPLASIVCTLDRAIEPAWSRRMAQEWLGVEPVEIETGHSPMLARPTALADRLVALI